MLKKAKLLLVDDDDALRQSLRDQPEFYKSFSIDEASSGSEALEFIKRKTYELVLLDVGLPDMDGRSVCRSMRSARVKACIILMTGADTEANTSANSEAGSDDYVTKPFKLSNLLSRIDALLNHRENIEDGTFNIGPYMCKPSAKIMVDTEHGGNKVKVTEKELEILKFLFDARDKIISRDVLLHEVWGYNSGVTTHTLETHVYRLRQKIERDPSNAELLVTEPGGYRLKP